MNRKLFARYPIGNPERKWKQDNFILAVSNPGPTGLEVRDEKNMEKTRRGVETAVEAGFNLLEMLWASPEEGMEILRTAERLGAKVSYQNLRRFGGMGFTKKFLNEDNDLLGTIRDTKAWSCISSYYVYDEPTNEEQRKVTRELIELMERECPHLLPYTVAAAKPYYVDTLADEVSPAQLSFDIYPFGNIGQTLEAADQLDKANFWYYFEVARCAAKRIGAPLWFYYQGHQLFYKPSFDRYTFTASRMMANAALLHGAKQISAYVEFDGYVDPATGGKGVFFEEQKKLNEETAKLGNTLMALECHRVLHDPSVENLTKYAKEWSAVACPFSESELLTGELPHRISVSELSDAYGHKYLMVLNRDYRMENHYCLKLKEPACIYKVSEKDGLEHYEADGTQKIFGHLSAGSIALYRIQPVEKEQYLLEYYLKKDVAKKEKKES